MRINIFIIIFLLFLPAFGIAQSEIPGDTITHNDSVAKPEYKNTFEFGVCTDFVSSGFGHWNLGRVRYTHTRKKFSWLVNTDYMYRKNWGGFAFVPTIGAYSDWCGRFYTYESITASTKSQYAPCIRGDLDLNFKAGQNKDWVITLGASAMDYYTEQSIFIVAAGLTYYHPGVVASCRFMYNICNPGLKGSFTGLVSVDQGYLHKYMNTLTVSYGNQSYLITSLGDPLHVERNAFSVSFRHRYWIRPNWGAQGQVEYTNVFNAYWMFGCDIGFFFHF